MSRRRGAFTLLEMLLALGLSVLLLGLVFMLGRHFLFGFLWTGDTLSGAHEAAVIHAALRRDLLRAALGADGSDLSVTVAPGGLSFTQPGTPDPRHIAYRLDAARGVLVREAVGDPTQVLGGGLVTKFEVKRVYVRKGAQGMSLVDALDAEERPWRAGLRVTLAITGQDVGPAHVPRTFEMATNIFPGFANERLASIWRASGP